MRRGWQLSGFGVFLLSLASCASGPKVTVCISNPINGSFECSPPKGDEFSLPFEESENYVCMSPKDTERLFRWVKRRCLR